MLSIQRRNRTQAGFTLIEMLIVAPIILLTIVAFIGIIIALTGEVLVSRTENSLAYKVQDALDTIEQDVTLSGAFLATNNLTLTSPQGYNNATQAFLNASSTTGAMLILNSPATTEAPNRPERKLIQLANTPNACTSPDVQQNRVMTYNIVYFIKDNTLWKRTLMPSNYATKGCSATPWQQPSCAPIASGTFCKTQDVKLLTGVTTATFTIEYFANPQSTTPVTGATNQSATTSSRQTALNGTNSIKVTLSATETVAGRDATYSGTLRASRIGSLVNYATPVP